jgi:hypothetical protein
VSIKAGGEQWVVGEHGADADHDRVHLVAEQVNLPTRGGTTHPAAIAPCGGDAAVEGHLMGFSIFRGCD